MVLVASYFQELYSRT